MSGTSTAKGQRSGRAGAPPIEYLTLALRCPICDTEFTCELPRPGSPQGRDSDLRPRFDTIDPLPFLIPCCPSCRYTAYLEGYPGSREPLEEDLDELGAWSHRPGDRPPTQFAMPDEDELDYLRRWIRRGELKKTIPEGREPFGAERYLLGARCYEFLHDDDPYGLADFYVRASWCARATGDRELERSCQSDAAARLQICLDQGHVPESDQARAQYLVAELSRRAGDFARAVDGFTQLESNVDPDDEESVLFARLARRQLALAIVKSDVDGALPEDEIDLDSEIVGDPDDEDDGDEE